MPDYPALDGYEVIKVLEDFGFRNVRTKGSHHVMRKEGHPARQVPVPVHGHKSVPPGTLRSIIRMAGLTPQQFFSRA